MPELPEVEEASRRLAAAALGKRIVGLVAHHQSLERRLPLPMRESVIGRRVDTIRRIGKYQLIGLDGGAHLVAHFRLDGDWVIGRSVDELPRFARAHVDLEDGTRVVFEDRRALGTLHVVPAGQPPVADLGPDPTEARFDAGTLRARLRGRRVAIKQALLDQRVVAGVGNIYAVEALWHARIHPMAPAGHLRLPAIEALLVGLKWALERGASRVARYRNGGRSIPLAVYDRAGEPCRRCGTKIRRMVMGGRGTYFCPACQRRPRAPR